MSKNIVIIQILFFNFFLINYILILSSKKNNIFDIILRLMLTNKNGY